MSRRRVRSAVIAAAMTWAGPISVHGGGRSTALAAGVPAPITRLTQPGIHGDDASARFGEASLVLSNGNIVVADPGFHQFFNTPDIGRGMVWIYDGAGQKVLGQVGSWGGDFGNRVSLAEVGASNVVLVTPDWGGGRGAVTWFSGDGVSVGSVSAMTSVVGAAQGDHIGSGGITPLGNGDFVISSPEWNGGRGAVQVASGNGPTAHVVGSDNALVGGSPGDAIGSGGVVPFASDGAFAIASPSWSAGAGAVTWSPAGGLVGLVDGTNSVVGGTGDHVGSAGVTALANGNYVIASPEWSSGRGAATWVQGGGPAAFTPAASNSLVGSAPGDGVGQTVAALTNGNFVVSSPDWSTGLGAATWGAGTSGIMGIVSAANSLIGQSPGDHASSGGVTPLANGNYVIGSPEWSALGLATWGDGETGLTGVLGAENSIYGTTPNDQVGANIVALTNGNYVVGSPSWSSVGGSGTGAATWAPGDRASKIRVNDTNSIVGRVALDQVGGDIVPLANGNFMLVSPSWDGGGISRQDVGAVTWVAGDQPSAFTVSGSNSFVGGESSDAVGSGGVIELTGGDVVVSSPHWRNGAALDAGAVTWMSGSSPTIGTPSPQNSLVGTSTNDLVGGGTNSVGAVGTVFALENGNYEVFSPQWHKIGCDCLGAMTFGPAAGIRGAVSTVNSLTTNSPLTTQTSGELFLGAYNRGSTDHIPAKVSAAGLIPVKGINRDLYLYGAALGGQIAFGPAPRGLGQVAEHTLSKTLAFSLRVFDSYGTPPLDCDPPYGSQVPIGTTPVTCSATNAFGVRITTSFEAEVLPNVFDYEPVTPARIVDTRPGSSTVDGTYAGGGQLSAGSALHVAVSGRRGVGPALPFDVQSRAVALNLTVTNAAAAGYLTAYPCGAAPPTASNLNFVPGTTVANAAIVGVAETGDVCFFASQPVDLIVDVVGRFPMAAQYLPIAPVRLMDTRPGQPTFDGSQRPAVAVDPGSVTVLEVRNRANIPAYAASVTLNVTVTEPDAPGYLTVYPCGTAPPTASNLNYVRGQTVAGLAISDIAADGRVCLFSQQRTHIVVDASGWSPPGGPSIGLTPARLFDSRPDSSTADGTASGGGPLNTGTVTPVQITGRGGVPADAGAAILNVTVTNPVAEGYVTAFPCGIDPPNASTVNFAPRQTVPNAAIVRIGTAGRVCFFASQPLDLVVDVTGYVP